MKDIRVLVVDDSAFNRRTITKMLDSEEGIEVIGYASDGEEALRKVFDLKPDLVTLDLEMPRMDGFTFLRILMNNRPTPVIVVSARTQDEDVFKALEFGAVEFVAKPSARISPDLINIREGLLQKVLAAARTDMDKVLGRSTINPSVARGASQPPGRAPKARSAPSARPKHVEGKASVVVIGASTGGPPALQKVLVDIDHLQAVGVVVAQHMPSGFTRAFADRLNRFCRMEIREAQTGDKVQPRRVLIAPGGKNLFLVRRGRDVVVQLKETNSEYRYVPSADALFQSAAAIYGKELLGVVLTGMGNDGASGVQSIHARGGQVLAESEETSVVYGMPKEAVATGCVDRELPLREIGGEIALRCRSHDNH